MVTTMTRLRSSRRSVRYSVSVTRRGRMPGGVSMWRFLVLGVVRAGCSASRDVLPGHPAIRPRLCRQAEKGLAYHRLVDLDGAAPDGHRLVRQPRLRQVALDHAAGHRDAVGPGHLVVVDQ